VRYLWFRNLQALPAALREARRVLAAREPKLVVVIQRPARIDEAGVTERILRDDYERVATVDGVLILRPKPAG